MTYNKLLEEAIHSWENEIIELKKTIQWFNEEAECRLHLMNKIVFKSELIKDAKLIINKTI